MAALCQALPAISIHALLAESDRVDFFFLPDVSLFLSTLSLRRATISVYEIPYQRQIFLSTLSLRRATQNAEPTEQAQDLISIHALLAESDKFVGWKA